MHSPKQINKNWGMEIKSSFYEPITLKGKLSGFWDFKVIS